MGPAGLNGAVTGLAGGLDPRPTARAEGVARLYTGATARAVHLQRLAQDEVEYDPYPIE